MTLLKQLYKLLSGQLIILELQGEKLVVYTGEHSTRQVKEAATVFFKEAYKLGKSA